MTDFKQRFEDLKAMFTDQQLQDFLDDPDAFLAENLGADPQVESAPVAVPPRMGAGSRRGRKKEDSVPKMVRNTFQKFENEDDLDVESLTFIEAIIAPSLRPAFLVQKDEFVSDHKNWLHLNNSGDARNHILHAIPHVGQIYLKRSFRPVPLATGFVVGKDLIMTNRHVASSFVTGLGQDHIEFQKKSRAMIDFKAEHKSSARRRLKIVDAVMIHPFWDMAILRVDGLSGNEHVLELSQRKTPDIANDEIAAIGYPQFDPRYGVNAQEQVFKGIYKVKRIQPGVLGGRQTIKSYGNRVSAQKHDSSTLGGNSGSALVHLDSGEVVGLHFSGIEAKSNFAVPTSELAKDPFVVAAGVHFAGAKPRPKKNPYAAQWKATQVVESSSVPTEDHVHVPPPPPQNTGAAGSASPSLGGPQEITLNVPIKLTVGFDTAALGALGVTQAGGGALNVGLEKAVEPVHDDDYSTRAGYDPDFLGVHVPMPVATNPGDLSVQATGESELKYHNFSILHNAQRRLAQITAANVDASEDARRPEDGFNYNRRALNGFTNENDREKWFEDPRIPAADQLPDRFYNQDRTAFDKGHLVRRVAVAFGDTFEDVQMANGDTFHSTNCSPQVKGFNRSRLAGLWGKLENAVLNAAKTERCVAFSGPVFDASDPEFHGRDMDGATVVQIPSRYWKMIITREGEGVATHAYLLSQDLSDVDFEFAGAGEWTEFEIDPSELELLLGNVTFPHLDGFADKMSLQEWRDLISNPETSEAEIMEVSEIVQGAGAFDFALVPDPQFVHIPDDEVETENAMQAANGIARSRREFLYDLRRLTAKKMPVLVSETDSWGQFPFIVREVIDHLSKDHNVLSLGAAGDWAENMVFGAQEPGATEYMMGLNKARKHVQGFIFSGAGNDIIGEDPATGDPVLLQLLKPFNGDTSDIDGHINHDLLDQKVNFLRQAYGKVISDIRADADFVDLPIFIHGYDVPFPYPWINDNRRPIHAAKDKWLGKPMADRGIVDRDLRRGILTVFIDRLYDMLNEHGGDPQQTKVWVVDCRGALPNVSDWIDEIHGTSRGFKKVADRFRVALTEAGVK